MPARKPDGTRAEVIELAKAGHSVRAIEGILAKRKVQFGKSAIAELVRLYRAGGVPEPKASTGKPAGKAPAPKAPAPVASSRTSPATSPAPPSTSRPGRPPDDETPLDAAEVADLDLAQLVGLARLFDTNLRAAVTEKDTKLAAWLLGARKTVSQEIARLRPPVLPDPDKDPANLLARDELRARLERAVEAYEGSSAGLSQLRAHVARAEAAAARRGDVPLADPPATTDPETA